MWAEVYVGCTFFLFGLGLKLRKAGTDQVGIPLVVSNEPVCLYRAETQLSCPEVKFRTFARRSPTRIRKPRDWNLISLTI